jgi:hypothetical protein
LPLQIKVPLEATAIVLIGIFSIYVYQREKSHRSYLPSMPQDRLSAQHEKTRKTDPVAPAPPAFEKKQRFSAEFNAKGSVQEPTKPAPAGPRTSAPEAPAPSLLEGKKEQSDSAATSSQGTSEESTPPPEGVTGAAPSSIEPLRQEGIATTAVPSDRTLSSHDQPVPDYELVIRLRSPERRRQPPTSRTDALSKSAETDKPSRGRQSSIAGETVASPSTKPPPRTVWYSVPQNRYEEFKKNLTAQGVIEFETAASTKEKEAARNPEDPLSIKVTILPPR